MITKPEDAVPTTYHAPITLDCVHCFTAAQAAEIANAYGEECAKSAQGYKNRQNAWEAKFKEWGT